MKILIFVIIPINNLKISLMSTLLKTSILPACMEEGCHENVNLTQTIFIVEQVLLGQILVGLNYKVNVGA